MVILSQRFCVYLSDEHEGKTIPQTEKKPTSEEGVGWPGWRGEPAHKAGVLYVLCFVLNFVFFKKPEEVVAALLGIPVLSRGVRHLV